MGSGHEARIRAELEALLGREGLLEAERCEALLVDERRLYRGRALAVVQPASSAQCAAVAALCHRHGVPMVPQGGNTGYCGGATPNENGAEVLVNMSRMNAVRALDRTGLTLTVEAGATLADVQNAAAGAGLLFPLSMGSELSCQIGGNLATNAGGLAVLKYGTARELVLGLEVVLADGRVLSELEGLRKNNTGYPLAQLFCGAEGTLGIITAATLKLFPRPARRHTLWLALAELAGLDSLLLDFRTRSGDCVTSFEYVSRRSLEHVLAELGGSDPLEEAAEHYALVELSSAGAADALAGELELMLGEAMEDGRVTDGVIASSERQRAELWALRERIPDAERRLGGSIKHDVAVAVSALPAFVAALERALAERHPECRLSIYGHVGDGNVHFNVLPPPAGAAEGFVHREGPAISRLVHDLTAQWGGSFSAEHGVGRWKAGDLARYADPVRLDLMRALKRALDPQDLMNRGKLFAD